MKIDKNLRICDISIKSIRGFFIRYRSPEKLTNLLMQQYFNISESSAVSLSTELISQGFIENIESGKYVVTTKGNALAQTKFVKRLNKDKAEKHLQKLMERVEKVNSDSSFLYRVKRLFLFGSYLDSTSEDFGDLDIAFELERKITDDDFIKAQHKLVSDVCGKGKVFASFLDEVCYAETMLLSYLKNRSPYISLHHFSDVMGLGAPYKQIYP